MSTIAPFNGGIQVPLGIFFFFFLTYTMWCNLFQATRRGLGKSSMGARNKVLGVVEVLTRNGENGTVKAQKSLPLCPKS